MSSRAAAYTMEVSLSEESAPVDARALSRARSTRGSSNARWSRQLDVFKTGLYPPLTWNLYGIIPPTADFSRLPLPEDFFKVISRLGCGAFGEVVLVETLLTGEKLAMKIIDKRLCSRQRRDRELIASILVGNSPFIVKYHSCFKTEMHCFILLQHYKGGNMSCFLLEHGKLNVEESRFYIAEITEGVLYLHQLGIMHRDLKLSNILLGMDNHVRICDLGLCKLGMRSKEKTHTPCGSVEYTAPEVLERQWYGREVDWWSVGIILYRMLTDTFPFFHPADPEEIELLIVWVEPDYSRITDEAAKHLVRSWLTKNPTWRLGYGHLKKVRRAIRGHPFFQPINWDELEQRHAEPPAMRKRTLRRATITHEMAEKLYGPTDSCDQTTATIDSDSIPVKAIVLTILAVALVSVVVMGALWTYLRLPRLSAMDWFQQAGAEWR